MCNIFDVYATELNYKYYMCLQQLLYRYSVCVGFFFCISRTHLLNVSVVAIGAMMMVMMMFWVVCGICCDMIHGMFAFISRAHDMCICKSITCSCFSWIWASTIEVFRNAGISIDSSGAKEDLWCAVSSIHDTVVAPSVIVATARFFFFFFIADSIYVCARVCICVMVTCDDTIFRLWLLVRWQAISSGWALLSRRLVAFVCARWSCCMSGNVCVCVCVCVFVCGEKIILDFYQNYTCMGKRAFKNFVCVGNRIDA